MAIRLGVVMDPIESIRPYKDSTFAMLLEAQRRGWAIHYMRQDDLFQRDARSFARTRPLRLRDNNHDWFSPGDCATLPLDELDVILMRKDPPFDMEYIYTTYLLEQAESVGSLVINRPAALRNANEKLATAWFPSVCGPTLVSRNIDDFRAFLDEQEDIVVKPLDGMGGASIFRICVGDPNRSVILETITAHGSRFAMAQRYIPEITAGDKRVLVIDGTPVPYALARIPAAGESRGNLAAGGSGIGVELSDRDYQIVETVAPRLRAEGIAFAGLDIIGDYLTEINITSPTCIRELDQLYGLNISADLLDHIEQTLAV